MEKRGKKYHRERLEETLREEIETLVEGELADPRIGLATVTEVQLAEDGRSARVLVSIHGDEREVKNSIEGLQAATGFIRYELVERLGLRRAPELIFHPDRSQKYEGRVDELLRRAKNRAK